MSTNKKKPPLGQVVHRPMPLLVFGYFVRAAHQIGAAVYLSSYLLPQITNVPDLFLLLTLISGALLLFTEGFRHRQMHREVSGLFTFVKLLLFGAAFHSFLPATATVTIAFLIASIGAHLPKNLRHRLLF